jgi:hypothetical protein
MVIINEGRKDDVFRKFQTQIENERNFLSAYKPMSFYDMIVNDPFIVKTNYKYLDPIMSAHFDWVEYDPSSEAASKSQAESFFNQRKIAKENIIDKLKYFDENISKFPVEYRDLSKMTGSKFDSFLNYVSKVKEQKSKRSLEREIKKNTELIYSDDNVFVVRPKSYESSCLYGKNTRWCTAARDSNQYYNKYTKNGALYYVILSNVDSKSKFKKVAIQTFYDTVFENSVYWDSLDNTMNAEQEELFNLILGKNALNAIINNYKKLVDENSKNLFNGVKEFLSKNPVDYASHTTYNHLKITNNVIANNLIDTISIISKNASYDEYMSDETDNLLVFTVRTHLRSELLKSDEKNSTGYITDILYGVNCMLVKDSFVCVATILDEFSKDEDENLAYFISAIEEIRFNFDATKVVPENIYETLVTTLNNYLNYHINRYATHLISYISSELNIKTPDQQYGWARYTFKKGGKLTKEFLKYLDKMGPDNPVTKKQFLVDIGKVRQTNDGWVNSVGDKIALSGYLSSFFSAAKMAGITKGTGHAFVQGPRFNEFKNLFDI